MGTIFEKLEYTLSAKNAISGAIENKGVEVGNTPLSGYADLIDQIETGGGGGDSSSVFYLSLNNNFIPSGQFEAIQMTPMYSYAMEDMEKGSWGGNFESDQNFGYVLSFPDQSSTFEEWDGELYPGYDTRNYWLEIPYRIESLLVKEEWTIECWFKAGDKWDTYSQGMIFGTQKYGGGLFSFGYNRENGNVSLSITSVNFTVGHIDAGTWNHLAAVRSNDSVVFYVNGSAVSSKLTSQLNIDSIGSAYLNDNLFSGFTTFSDYRIFQIAGIRLSDTARYTQGFSPTPGPYRN